MNAVLCMLYKEVIKCEIGHLDLHMSDLRVKLGDVGKKIEDAEKRRLKKNGSNLESELEVLSNELEAVKTRKTQLATGFLMKTQMQGKESKVWTVPYHGGNIVIKVQ